MITLRRIKMKQIKYLRDYLADLYLDWVNNFLTIERFAEYYGLDEDDAKELLVLQDDNFESDLWGGKIKREKQYKDMYKKWMQ